MQKATNHLQQNNLAAVYGKVIAKNESNAVDRWKSKYLYRKGEFFGKIESSTFLSGGAVVRRSAVMKIGNYNTLYKHSEDRDLGDRLIKSGFKILSDDDMRMSCHRRDSLFEVYERYWRWNTGSDISIYSYIKNVYYSLKEMVMKDLMENDFQKAFISLLQPHYSFFKSIIETKLKKEIRHYIIIGSILFLYLILSYQNFPFVKQNYENLALFDGGWILPVTEQLLNGKKIYTEVNYAYGIIPVGIYFVFAHIFGNTPVCLFWVTGIVQILNMLLIFFVLKRYSNNVFSYTILLLIIVPLCFDKGISYTSPTPYEIMYLTSLTLVWKPFESRSKQRSIIIGLYLILPYFIKFGSHLIAGLTIITLDLGYYIVNYKRKKFPSVYL